MDLFVMLLQSVAGKVTQNTPGKVAPASKVPEVSDSESIYRSEYPGAKRRKIRYGPYRVPSIKASLDWTMFCAIQPATN
jgi:hypothetical protein